MVDTEGWVAIREQLRGDVQFLFHPASQLHIGYDAATLTWLAAGQDDTCRAVLALSRNRVVGEAQYEVLRNACHQPGEPPDAGRLAQLVEGAGWGGWEGGGGHCVASVGGGFVVVGFES